MLVKSFGPRLLFVGRFLITVSISVLVIGLFRFSISYWLSFGKQYFSKYLSIYSSYQFYWHIVAHISLLEFCISVLSVVISPFSFLTLPILLFSLFFIMCLANSFSILFIFSKIQVLVLLNHRLVSNWERSMSRMYIVTLLI